MIFEKFIISKLIYGYKPHKRKNRDNLMEIDLLLFITNSAIHNLSNPLSYS